MRTAVVVGAGIAGLATAGALARTGWRVTLLERGDRVRPGRAALVLWPNGVRALRVLGLAGGLEGFATPAPPPGIRHPDGRWLLRPDAAATSTLPEPPLVVHQEDLHDAFIAGLADQVDLRTGVDVRTVGTVRERPAVGDGRVTFTADLVVAADGADSVIRKRLAPESVFVSASFAAWRAVIPWYRAPQFPSEVTLWCDTLGVGHRFVAASLGEHHLPGTTSRGGIYWVATAPGAARPEPPAAQLALLRRWFAGWHAPIPELLAATEPGDLVQDAVGEVRPLPASFGIAAAGGGYALVGDAGHAMTPHLGQGACLALEDVAILQSVLAEAVPGKTLDTALAEYGRLRKARVTRVLAQSRKVGSVLQPRNRLAVRARDMALGRLAPQMLAKTAAAASDWHPPSG